MRNVPLGVGEAVGEVLHRVRPVVLVRVHTVRRLLNLRTSPGQLRGPGGHKPGERAGTLTHSKLSLEHPKHSLQLRKAP